MLYILFVEINYITLAYKIFKTIRVRCNFKRSTILKIFLSPHLRQSNLF